MSNSNEKKFIKFVEQSPGFWVLLGIAILLLGSGTFTYEISGVPIELSFNRAKTFSAIMKFLGLSLILLGFFYILRKHHISIVLSVTFFCVWIVSSGLIIYEAFEKEDSNKILEWTCYHKSEYDSIGMKLNLEQLIDYREENNKLIFVIYFDYLLEKGNIEKCREVIITDPYIIPIETKEGGYDKLKILFKNPSFNLGDNVHFKMYAVPHDFVKESNMSMEDIEKKDCKYLASRRCPILIDVDNQKDLVDWLKSLKNIEEIKIQL